MNTVLIKMIGNVQNFTFLDIDSYRITNYPILTNNENVKNQTFLDKLFSEQIGNIGSHTLQSASHFFYVITNQTIAPEISISGHALLAQNLDVCASLISSFFFFLWFRKDHSTNTEEIYGHSVEGTTNYFMVISANEKFSNSKGEFKEESFVKEDLDFTHELMKQYMKICPSKSNEWTVRKEFETLGQKDGNNLYLKVGREEPNYNEKNRIERAIMFLHSARTSHYLPYKISFYMAIYECLFSTDSTDILYKLRQRVALYMRKSSVERREVSLLIRDAYNIRSKFIHGSALKKKDKDITYNELKEISVKIDRLTRELLTGIIERDSEKFLGTDESLNSFFDRLMFGEEKLE